MAHTTPGWCERRLCNIPVWSFLEEPVPIEIRYDLVEVRNGRVSAYRDVYHLSSRPLRAEVYAALAATGLDTTAVDSEGVGALVRRVRPAGNSIELNSILRRASKEPLR